MKNTTSFLAVVLAMELSAFGLYAGYSEVRHENDARIIYRQTKIIAEQKRKLTISNRLVKEYREDMKGYIVWKDSLKNKHSKSVEKMEEQYRIEFEADIDRSAFIGSEK